MKPLIAIAVLCVPVFAVGCGSTTKTVTEAAQPSPASTQVATTTALPVKESLDFAARAPTNIVRAETKQVTLTGEASPGTRIEISRSDDLQTHQVVVSDAAGGWRKRVFVQVGDNDFHVEATKPGFEDASDIVSVHRKQPPPGIGSTQRASGNDTDLSVKLIGVLDPLSAGQYDTPDAGKRYVGIQIRVTNVGDAHYDDSPGNGSEIIGDNDQQYDTTIVSEGPCGGDFQSDLKLAPDAVRVGCIPFEIPTGVGLSKFQFTMDSGFADDTKEWDLVGR